MAELDINAMADRMVERLAREDIPGLVAYCRTLRTEHSELFGTEQWLRYEWGKRGETIDRVTALCDQAERNYGGSAGMANIEAWVHLGSLRRALADPLPECNGICLYGSDLGVPSDGVAYAHPDCELHGHMATNNVDGSPR